MSHRLKQWWSASRRSWHVALILGSGALVAMVGQMPTQSQDDLVNLASSQPIDATTRDLAELNGMTTLGAGQVAVQRESSQATGDTTTQRILLPTGGTVDLPSRGNERTHLVNASPDLTTFVDTSDATEVLGSLLAPEQQEKIDTNLVAEFEDGSLEEAVIVEVDTVVPPEADDTQAEQATKEQNTEKTEQRLDSALGRNGEVDESLDLGIAGSVAATVDATGLAKLAADPTVKRIELDAPVTAFLDTSLGEIKARETWASFDRSNQSLTGVGRRIAIIDTGVNYRHPDLGGCFGANCKVVGGYDFVNNDADPLDDHGHGTHVAATAAGKGTLYGVAPDAQILAYKVLNASGSGSFSSVIAAINRATDPNNDGDTSDHVDVVNMSLGGPGNPDDAVSRAVDNSSAAGVVHVIAAGNSGPAPSTIGSPGTARSAITVAAACKTSQIGIYGYCASPIASFSSRGPLLWQGVNIDKPDLAAPGVAICAAWITASNCGGASTSRLSGTSMATPHVAGAAALARQASPDSSPAGIKQLLKSTARPFGGGIGGNDQGAGLIDLAAAIPNTATVSSVPSTWAVATEPNGRESVIRQSFTITPHGADVTLTPTVGLAHTGIALTFDTPSITATSSTPATVTATVTVNNDVAASGTYQTSIVLAEGGTTRGVIPLTITVTPTISISPTDPLNYGVDSPGQDTWTSAPQAITVTNHRTDKEATVTASATGFPSVVSLTSTPAQATVAPGGTTTLATTLSVANRTLANGIHRGTVVVAAGNVSSTIAAEFTKFYVLDIADPTGGLQSGIVWVHDRQSTQYTRWMSTSSTSFYMNTPGPYDVIASYPQTYDGDGRHITTVFRENINLGSGQAAVSMTRADAKNAVDFEPTTAAGQPAGNLLDMHYGIVFTPRTSITAHGTLTGYYGTPDVTKHYYSDVSSNYRVIHEFIHPGPRAAGDMYLYYDTFQGLSGSQTTRVTPADLRAFKQVLNVNRTEGAIAPQLTTCLLSLPCLTHSPYLANTLPLEQTIYAMTAPTLPAPNDSRLAITSDSRRTDCTPSADPCASIFSTPWLSLGTHGARRFFDPLPAMGEDTIYTGLGPVLPAFKFLNGRTNVNLYPYWYAPKAVFVRSDYSLGEYEATPYRVVNAQGGLVNQGSFPRFTLTGSVSPSSPQGPFFSVSSRATGQHELIVDAFHYKLAGQALRASYSSKFTLTASDPNPPVFKSLAFRTGNVRSEQYIAGQSNRLEFGLDPLGSTIKRAAVLVATDGGSFTSQTVTENGGTYSVTLPELGQVGIVSVRIEADDATGNTLRYTFQLPANLDLSKPTASFRELQSGAYLVGRTTIKADARDDRGIAKVELYRNNALVASSTTAPYDLPWDTKSVGDGYYTLSLRATDRAGNTSSQDVGVTVDNTAPTIYEIYQPGERVGRGIVDIRASHYDQIGVSKVEYLIDGQVHDQAVRYPWSVGWDTRRLSHDSQHSLVARVTDVAGNVATSPPKRVTIYDPPPPPEPPKAAPPPAPAPEPVQPAPAPAPAPVAPAVSAPKTSASQSSAPKSEPSTTVSSSETKRDEPPPLPPRELRSLNKKEQRQKVTLERKVRSAEASVRKFERSLDGLRAKEGQLKNQSGARAARSLRTVQGQIGKTERSLNGARDALGRAYANLDRLIYK